MKKLLLKILQPIRKAYWWLVRPTTRGARAIVLNQEGKLLLVRHTYQDGWYLPGGKAEKNEGDEQTLRRELQEELGIDQVLQPEKLGEYTNNYEYKKDTIVLFVVRSFKQKQKPHSEIEESLFFDARDLPKGTSPGTRRRIEEWLGDRVSNSQW